MKLLMPNAKAGAAKAAPKKKTQKAPIKQKAKEFDLDDVCAKLADGISMAEIARFYEKSIGCLSMWLAKIEHSARAREARELAARLWDEKAIDCVEDAQTPFELQKAKELAHHYRWRAAKAAPRDYGDRQAVELSGKGGAPIMTGTVSAQELAEAVSNAREKF